MKKILFFSVILIASLFFPPNPCQTVSPIEDSYDKGMEYGIKGRFNEAKIEFVKGLNIDPNYGPIKQGVKIIEDLFNKKIKIATAIHLFKSADYANKGRLDESIAEDEIAIALNPKYTTAYNNLGISYLQKSQYEKAVFYLDKAIGLDPNCYEAFVLRGLADSRQKKFNWAISDFSKAIKLNPKESGIYYNRALAYFFKRDYRNAIKDATKAKEMGYKIPPTFIDSLRNELKRQI